MTRSESWSFIKDYINRDPAGKQVQTTLLGDVNGTWRDGEVVGIIPFDLGVEARQHGFRIVMASVQDGTYTLEKLK